MISLMPAAAVFRTSTVVLESFTVMFFTVLPKFVMLTELMARVAIVVTVRVSVIIPVVIVIRIPVVVTPRTP